MFSSGCFKSKFGVAASLSDACFMCFICLQTYVASVVSGRFKSRSGVCISVFTFLLSHLRLRVSSSSSRCRLGIGSPLPLLDAGITTCYSHLRQLLTTCMHVRSRGDASGDSPRAVGRRGPCVGGHGMQVHCRRRHPDVRGVFFLKKIFEAHTLSMSDVDFLYFHAACSMLLSCHTLFTLV
jgi:hypothetical protein